MTFTELKAQAASIVAAARAAGQIKLAEPPGPIIYAPRIRPPRRWGRTNVHCKYCKTPIPNPAKLQVMCSNECRRLQRNLKARELNPPNTDKSRDKYLRRKKQQAAYKAQILSDAKAFRTLKGLPLETPRSQRRLALEHAKAYRKLMKKKPRSAKNK